MKYDNAKLIQRQVKNATTIDALKEWRLFVETCWLANMLQLSEVNQLVKIIQNCSDYLREYGKPIGAGNPAYSIDHYRKAGRYAKHNREV